MLPNSFDVSSLDLVIGSKDCVFLTLNASMLDYKDPESLDLINKKLQNYARFISSAKYREEFGSIPANILIGHFTDPPDKLKLFASEVSKSTGIQIEFINYNE